MRNPFDLVISDLVMPEADGLEVLKTVQKIRPQTTVLYMTAFTENEKDRRAKKLLKDNFLLKSAGQETFMIKINNIIGTLLIIAGIFCIGFGEIKINRTVND